MPAKAKPPKVTIIIPVYNAERYLQQCLDSVYVQTLADWEIIAVDDGSTDRSAEILHSNAAAHKKLRILTQSNHGQGYARNRALERARGMYILFVDADDAVDSKLLEKAISRAERDNADVINFNWQILHDGKLTYFNKEPFASKSILRGIDCEQFLRKNNYFGWDSLYRAAFLEQYKIRFGEGYIYEDNEFIVQVASYAKTISLIDEPLYTLGWSGESSTRGKWNSAKHSKDFLRAMQRSFTLLRPRSVHSSFYLAAYFLEKFIVYYERRVPRYYRHHYLREFVDCLGTQALMPSAEVGNKFLRACLRRQIFTGHKYNWFYMAVQYKTKLLPLTTRLRKLQQR